MNKLESLAKKNLQEKYESVWKLGPQGNYIGSVSREIDDNPSFPENAITLDNMQTWHLSLPASQLSWMYCIIGPCGQA